MLGNVAFTQTIESIDSLKKQIDNTCFSDTVLILDTISSKEPIQVTAFLKGDTLLKTIVKYKDTPRIRLSYYQCVYENRFSPVYVQDIDSLTNEIFLEVYGNHYQILKSNIIKPLSEQEKKFPQRILNFSDYQAAIVAFELVDRKASKYKLTGKLVEALPLTPHCGIFAFAIVQKFEIISTTYPDSNQKFILLIQPCPEFLGKNFFNTGEIYDMDIATNSGNIDYIYTNDYEEEKLSILWIREIKKTKKE